VTDRQTDRHATTEKTALTHSVARVKTRAEVESLRTLFRASNASNRVAVVDRHTQPDRCLQLCTGQSGGRLRRPLNVPVDIFADELEFYELGADVVDRFRADEGLTTDHAADEQLPALPHGQFRRAVWLLFEYPESSSAARVVAVLSVSVILLSVVTFCVETLPQFKQYRIVRGPAAAQDNNGTRSRTAAAAEQGGAAVAIVGEDDIPTFSEPLFVIETICVVWFTSEVALRFAAAPDHLAFFRSPMNVIDVVSVVPYFITLSTIVAAESASDNLVSSMANNQVLLLPPPRRLL